MEEWARRLLELYKNSGVSHREIAKATGIPKSAVQRYLTGETDNIPLDRIKKLAAYFGVTAEYILDWEPDPEEKLMAELRESFRRNPGMRVLFDASKNAKPEDLVRFARMIEAWKNE